MDNTTVLIADSAEEFCSALSAALARADGFQILGTAGDGEQAIRMVSAFAQARMLEAIEAELTEQEADITRRGRNAQAKHAAPKNADPADYAHATGLEALWGYLYLSGETERLDTLIRLALTRTEDIWHKQSSK